MRIPKFLLRLRHTRLWRYKWIILTFTPFIVVALILLGFSGYRHYVNSDALEKYHNFVSYWEDKGEIIDLDLIYSSNIPDSDDVFSHPAFIDESNELHAPALDCLAYLKLPGLSTNKNDYFGKKGKGSHQEGFKTDISSWLNPAQPHLSEKEAAEYILAKLTPFNERLDNLAKAAARPKARYPSPLDDEQDISAMMGLANRTVELTSQRAILRLITGEPDLAFDDIKTLLQLEKHARANPNLLGLIVSIIHISNTNKVIWEAVTRQSLTDKELAYVAEHYKSIDLKTHMIPVMRTEIAFGITVCNDLIHEAEFMNPPFSFPQFPKITSARSWETFFTEFKTSIEPGGKEVLDTLNMWLHMINNGLYSSNTPTKTLDPKQIQSFDARSPLSIGRYIKYACETQAEVNNLRISIALERYRIKHHGYPAKLSDLVPEYCSGIPLDIYTDKPLNYRIKPDGTPFIHSVGYDQTDDKGTNDDIPLMYTPTP